MKLYDYEIARLSRPAMGASFNKMESSYKLDRCRRKRAEFEARQTSRAHPRQVVILRRQGGGISLLINGRTVDPRALSFAPRFAERFSLAVSIPQRAAV